MISIREALKKKVGRDYTVLAFMIFATTLANFANYCFNIVAARLIGKEEYGILASLLSIFIIFSVPNSAVQAMVARQTAVYHEGASPDKARSFQRSLLSITTVAGSGFFLFFLILSPFLNRLLRVGSTQPLITLGGAIALATVYPVPLGTLQGYQRFGHMGANMVFQALCRLILGVIFIHVGWGVGGAIGASTASLAAALLLASLQGGFAFTVPARTEKTSLLKLFKELSPIILIFVIFWSYTSIDVVIGRKVLGAGEAGEYACAVFMGKIILFLPTAISMVMFPKTAAMHAKGERSSGTAIIYIGICVALCGIACMLYALFPKTLITLLYGNEYANASNILWMFGLSMTLYSLISILLYYFLSIKMIWPTLLLSSLILILEAVLMSTIARSPILFAWIHLASSFLLSVCLTLLFIKVKALEARSVKY